MSESVAVLENVLEPSAVHLYVCAVLSRALARQDLLELPGDADEGVREPSAAPSLSAEIHEPQIAPEPVDVIRYAGDEMLVGDRDEEEPEDWIVFEGDVNVVSEFQTLAAELSYTQGGVGAGLPSRTSSGRSLEKLQERVANTVKDGVTKVGEVGDKIACTVSKVSDKISPVIVHKFNAGFSALDEVTVRHTKDIEDLVKLKAALIDDKARAIHKDACLTAEKCSWKLEEFEGRSRVLSKEFESWVNQSGAMDWFTQTGLPDRLQNSATLMSTKAKAVSQAARTAARRKTEPTYGAVRRGLKSAHESMQRGFA